MIAMFFILPIISLVKLRGNTYNYCMNKWCFWFLCIFGFCFCACHNQKIINEKESAAHQRGMDILQYNKLIQNQKSQAVQDYIASLDLEEKIAQLFVVNLVGCDEFIPVEQNIAGGFLYFGYNIAPSVKAMIHFNQSIIDYCKANNKIPPFLSVDQEGGYVNRLRNLNGPLPSAERVAEVLSEQQAQDLYTLQALQMNALGFNMNFAPVTEVCTKDNEKFLTERSFGTLQDVLAYGQVSINAYESNGVGTVIKHFPGNTNTDPHTGLPEIKWDETELKMQLTSFRELVKNQPAGVLMSHARVKGYDENNPACLSKYWVTKLLRNDFGYNGIIFSDDIFMGALANNGYPPEVAVVAAIEAGIDCIMISEKRIDSCVKILCNKAEQDKDFAARIDESVRRMLEYKMKMGYLSIELEEDWQYKLIFNYPQLETVPEYEKFDNAKNKNIELYTEYFK